MVTDAQELVLPLLREIRTNTERTDKKVGDIQKHMTQLERQLAGVRGDIAVFQEMHADQSDRIRTIEERLDRLERQTGLSEAFQQ